MSADRNLLFGMLVSGCGGSSDGAGSGGDGLLAACQEYAFSGAPDWVTLRVVNQGTASIWVEDGCRMPFGLSIDGEPKKPFTAFGELSCGGARAGVLPCCDCFQTQTVVPPGDTFERDWAQIHHQHADMPLSCVGEGATEGYDGCTQTLPVPDAKLVMTVQVRRCLDDTCPSSETVSQPFVLGQDPIELMVP